MSKEVKEKKPLHEDVAERLIDQLEKGTSPFHLPWKQIDLNPMNPVTGRTYSGMNRFWMLLNARPDPRWMTYKQAQSKGWQVKKGSKGLPINVVKTHREVNKKDENGKVMKDENGKPIKVFIKLENPYIRSAVVFNAEQIDGVPELERQELEQTWMEEERVEKIIENSEVIIKPGGNDAFYNPIADYIGMPDKDRFANKEGYYSTLLHEMAHWTGHPSRLNRPMVTKFGTPEYAKEELRAEIASLMIAGDYGVRKEFGQHAAYVKSWIQVLKNDPYEIFAAAADAQKIMDHIKKFENKRELKIEDSMEKSFMVGDKINHKNTEYRVSALLPSKALELTIDKTGEVLTVTPSDGLYHSLKEILHQSKESDIKQENTRDENSHKIGR